MTFVLHQCDTAAREISASQPALALAAQVSMDVRFRVVAAVTLLWDDHLAAAVRVFTAVRRLRRHVVVAEAELVDRGSPRRHENIQLTVRSSECDLVVELDGHMAAARPASPLSFIVWAAGSVSWRGSSD